MALSISRALPHILNSLQDPISATCSKRWSTSTSPGSSLCPNNLKNWFLPVSAFSQNSCFHSSLASRRWLGRRVDNRSEKDHHNQTFCTEKRFGILLAVGGSCVIGLVLDNRLTEKGPESELKKSEQKVNEPVGEVSSDIREQEHIGRLTKDTKDLATFWNISEG